MRSIPRYSLLTIDLETFEPQGDPLSPLAELLAIADLPFDQVKDLGEDLGWLWSPDNLNGESSGWNVTESQIEDAISGVVVEGSESVAEETEKLTEEETEPRLWERATALTIVTTLYVLFLLGIGGRDRVSQGDEIYIRDRARNQLMYLRTFAFQVASGDLSVNQIRARIQYYINDIRIGYDEVLRRAYQNNGWQWEKSVLSQAEHCPTCVIEADKGWSPIGTLVRKGERDCLFNCKCHWQFSRSIAKPADFTVLRGWGWIS